MRDYLYTMDRAYRYSKHKYRFVILLALLVGARPSAQGANA